MRYIKSILCLLAVVVAAPFLIKSISPNHSPFLKREFDIVRNFFAEENINLVTLAPQKDIEDRSGNKLQKIIYAGTMETARIWGIILIRVIKNKKTQEIFLDPTFGVNGQVTTIMPKDVTVLNVVIEKNGKITVYGRYGSQQIITRYLEDGAPDTTFGDNNGILVR